MACALVVVGTQTISASSLKDYAGRIRSALAAARGLTSTGSGNQIIPDRTTAETIRKLIPVNERIDLPSGGIDTDNRWLHEALDTYLKTETEADQLTAMNAIKGRLTSLENAITGLEDATEATRSKDEDKRKLAEILSRQEYQKSVNGESLAARWFREFMEWLRRIFPRPDIGPTDTLGLPNFAFLLQILLYVLLTAAIGFLIYRLLPLVSDRFANRKKPEKRDRIILGEVIGQEETGRDLFADAERLALAGDLRLAIRKGYIALLCELSDRRIIGLARHKTNRDYLRDVRKNEQLLHGVTGLTGSFERNWYGLLAAEPQDWEEFRDLYKRVIANV